MTEVDREILDFEREWWRHAGTKYLEAAARWVYNEFVNFIVNFLHGTTAVASLPDAVLEGEAFQNKLKSLPPEVTAVELLRLRTDLLLTQRRPARRRRSS